MIRCQCPYGARSSFMADQITVVDVPERNRYEAVVDGEVAFAEYMLRGDVVTFVHTLVPGALEGRGVGSALARAALDDSRARGRSVVPRCPFIRAYIDRHEEYADLVDASAASQA
jgi:predicted GNAT family acetyltransferase